jgi:hypothetical protein
MPEPMAPQITMPRAMSRLQRGEQLAPTAAPPNSAKGTAPINMPFHGESPVSTRPIWLAGTTCLWPSTSSANS